MVCITSGVYEIVLFDVLPVVCDGYQTVRNFNSLVLEHG